MATTTSTVGTREVFIDQLGPSRALRLTWHPEHGVAVLSLWADDGAASRCVSTFRMPVDDVPDLVHRLTGGLAAMATTPPVAPSDCVQAVDGAPRRGFADRARAGLVRALDGASTASARARDRLGRD